MKYFLCLALGGFIFPLNLHAELSEPDCPINILQGAQVSSEVKAHFATPFNQYGSNLCYAHAAADILSFTSQRSLSPVALSVEASSQSVNDWSPLNNDEMVDVLDTASNNLRHACLLTGFNSRNLTEKEFMSLKASTVVCSSENQIELSPLNFKFYRDCNHGRRGLDGQEAFKDQMITSINTELENGYPVAVSVDVGKLTPNATPPINGKHSMTLIGRVWNNSQRRCEYVFRNSYGEEACGDFDTSLVRCDNLSTESNGFPSSGILSMSEQVFKNSIHRAVIIYHSAPANSASEKRETVQVVMPSNCD